MPPLNSPEIQDAQYWEPGLAGHRFLKLKVIPLDEIGADPHKAADWAARTADPERWAIIEYLKTL